MVNSSSNQVVNSVTGGFSPDRPSSIGGHPPGDHLRIGRGDRNDRKDHHHPHLREKGAEVETEDHHHNTIIIMVAESRIINGRYKS